MPKGNWRVELQASIDAGLARLALAQAEADTAFKRKQAELAAAERRIAERIAHLDQELATVERVAIATTNAVYQATEGVIAQFALDRNEIEREVREQKEKENTN